jgi:hypothetical protein
MANKPTNLYLSDDDRKSIEVLITLFQREGTPLSDERGGKKGSMSALVRHLVKLELERRGIK